MIYLETSFLVSIIIEDEFSPFCKKMINDAKEKRTTIVFSTLTITEAIGLIENREQIKKEIVIEKLFELIESLKFKFVSISNFEIIKNAFLMWKNYKMDFHDILHYLIMKENKIKEIYSINGHFDTFKDIHRVIGEG